MTVMSSCGLDMLKFPYIQKVYAFTILVAYSSFCISRSLVVHSVKYLHNG